MNNVEIDKLKETLKEYADYAIKLVKENKRLQQENKQLKERINKARETLGQYKHYSVPTEEQNGENEDIVNKTYFEILGDKE